MPRAKKKYPQPLPPDLKYQLELLMPTAELTTTEEKNETFEKLDDNLFNALAHAEQKIKQIDSNAEVAINVITQAITTRANVEKGRILREIQEEYGHLSSFDGTFGNWLKEQNIEYSVANRWMNASKMVEDGGSIFGEEMLMGFSTKALARMQTLPTEAKLDLLEKAEETGKPPTIKEVAEVQGKTETKLSKAAELLQEARAKRQEKLEVWEEVKADPEIKSGTDEYQEALHAAKRAKDRCEELEDRIKELQTQLGQEQSKAASEADARKRTEEELEALKFDDQTVRDQRVKRIQSTLTVHIPQVQSDIQRFKAEYKHYPEEYQIAIDTLVKDLRSYLSEITE